MTAETTIVFYNLALEFSFGVYVLFSRMRFTKFEFMPSIRFMGDVIYFDIICVSKVSRFGTKLVTVLGPIATTMFKENWFFLYVW